MRCSGGDGLEPESSFNFGGGEGLKPNGVYDSVGFRKEIGWECDTFVLPVRAHDVPSVVSSTLSVDKDIVDDGLLAVAASFNWRSRWPSYPLLDSGVLRGASILEEAGSSLDSLSSTSATSPW